MTPAHLARRDQWGLLQRMKSSESTRLKAESSLREELENRWQKLQELAEERVRALRGQCKVTSAGGAWTGHLREETWVSGPPLYHSRKSPTS